MKDYKLCDLEDLTNIQLEKLSLENKYLVEIISPVRNVENKIVI